MIGTKVRAMGNVPALSDLGQCCEPLLSQALSCGFVLFQLQRSIPFFSPLFCLKYGCHLAVLRVVNL